MTEQSTALVAKQETGMTRVKNYLLSPEVKERFTEMMGANGIYYLNQVLILVANSEDLQECSPKSILISAMRAASLRLSVDPGQGQAWIIPYKKVATFQIGYRGVYELALRTNLYRFINVIDIYEGEKVEENRMTGIHYLSGLRTSDKVIARMLYFQMVSGFEKTFLMTVEEIEAHARHYSQAYNSNRSRWNDAHERPKMERKTVLINGLRKWGRFNSDDLAMLDQIDSEQGWNDRGLPEEGETTPPVVAKHTEAENMKALGFEADTSKTPRADANTGEVKQPKPAQPVAPTITWPANAKVSYDLAASVVDSKNTRYLDFSPERREATRKVLQKRLDENHLTEQELDAVLLKIDVLNICDKLEVL